MWLRFQDGMRWREIEPGRLWSSWLSRYSDGYAIDGSGVTFTGTLTDGQHVARTYDGREFMLVTQ